MHFSSSMEHSPAPVSISLEICAPPAAGIVRVCACADPPTLPIPRVHTRARACVPGHACHIRTTPFLRHLSLSCALQRICDPNNHFIVCSSFHSSHKNHPKFCTFYCPAPSSPSPSPGPARPVPSRPVPSRAYIICAVLASLMGIILT